MQRVPLTNCVLINATWLRSPQLVTKSWTWPRNTWEKPTPNEPFRRIGFNVPFQSSVAHFRTQHNRSITTFSDMRWWLFDQFLFSHKIKMYSWSYVYKFVLPILFIDSFQKVQPWNCCGEENFKDKNMVTSSQAHPSSYTRIFQPHLVFFGHTPTSNFF